MNQRAFSHRTAAFLLLLGFAFSLPGTLGLIPAVEAASPNASARIIKKLKKQIATLKKQLAAARAVPPTPAPFLEMVTVGNPGNTADSTTYGAVPYEYSIGKYEVTLAQYAAFLNAVAATDAYGLYNPSMATNLNIAGIERSGTSGSFTYSVIGTGTRPVTYVTWFDAARFCNWLHNGRPTGAQTAATTERGAYTLDGATGGVGFSRQWGAKYWIPSEDEWYKAAYHDARTEISGGPPGGDFYWLYPTGRDTTPGNTIGALANHANFVTTVYSVTQDKFYYTTENYLTAAGSYSGSSSFYGTFDQGGNVFEWNDAVNGSSREQRGGSWVHGEVLLGSSERRFVTPGTQNDSTGFRVAGP
jgi:sulfatase modifying factor 1